MAKKLSEGMKKKRTGGVLQTEGTVQGTMRRSPWPLEPAQPRDRGNPLTQECHLLDWSDFFKFSF